MSEVEKILTNCGLCGEHTLHIVGVGEAQTMQCIHCGYASSTKFVLPENGKKEENTSWMQLTDEMKKWSKVEQDRIWIPSIITLPFGMIYPFTGDEETMKWGLAELVNIPKNEQKNHPIEGQEGKFYETKMDTDNAKIYDEFYEALVVVNEKMKAQGKTPNIERLQDSKTKVVNEKNG
tara:strand:- start:7141 stop:7674 length:534 start_codon:yes stop_codon:yes gene_type:complete